jgi:TetR/AcrR family transcriptional regulator
MLPPAGRAYRLSLVLGQLLPAGGLCPLISKTGKIETIELEEYTLTTKGAYKVGKIRINNQKAILKAAEQEFAERGFNGASMHRIAEGAGVARTNVHYYFKNKEELYARVLTDAINMWDESFNQISADDDPAEALSAYIRAKVNYSKSKPLASRVFASEILHGAPVLSSYLKKDYREWLSGKAAILEQWAAQGKMDPVEPFYLIFMIWAATQHYADFDVQVKLVLGKSRLSAKDFDRIADNLIHIILKGCGIAVSGTLLDKE